MLAGPSNSFWLAFSNTDLRQRLNYNNKALPKTVGTGTLKYLIFLYTEIKNAEHKVNNLS